MLRRQDLTEWDRGSLRATYSLKPVCSVDD